MRISDWSSDVCSSDLYRMEKRYIAKNGAIVWGLLAVSLIRDADGKPAYFISQIQDMSHAHEIQQELEYKALHDPLTGLANRRKFQLALTDALDVTRHTGTEHCRSAEHTSELQSL